MANNKINENENILIKVDQNNLIYVDPNSVVINGNVQERTIKQENLVMYVNLEADLVPRSVLTSVGNVNTLTKVAEGTVNMLKPNTVSGDYDSTWTDSYFNFKPSSLNSGDQFQNDSTSQSFGIDSINVNIKGGGFIPQVDINFIDVRGKTLFESPENSPYKAFFHLPWPIFYLTIKGFYGKAIRYRLHMVSFNSKYNESNGNFDIATKFVGSTYAFLNDIPLKGILNAPYMFLTESEVPKKFNQNTQRYEKTISRTSKGFVLLKSVYSEYVNKGYLPSTFIEKPRTLREIITIAGTLDKILERELFDQVFDPKILSGIKEFENRVNTFINEVKAWGTVNLDKFYFEKITDPNDLSKNKLYYYLGKNITIDSVKSKDEKSSGTLQYIILNSIVEISKIKSFAENLKNKTGSNFKNIPLSFKNQIGNINKYIDLNESKYGIDIDTLLEDIYVIFKSFQDEKQKVYNKIEEKMNEIYRDKDKGLGFDPTIKNIFGVLMANADVYIRLLKDVHTKSFDSSKERAKLIGNLSKESTGDAIYPWPEIKKKTGDKKNILAYPGDKDLQFKLKSYDPIIWPEIDFLENYHAVATKRQDTLSSKEGGAHNISYVFSNDPEKNELTKISTALNLFDYPPYVSRTIPTVLYEIWERSKYVTLFDSFNNETIKELALNEFNNLQNTVNEDPYLSDFLRNITTVDKLTEQMFVTSAFEKYPYFQDDLPTTTNIQDILNKPFKIEQLSGSEKNQDFDSKFKNLQKNLTKYKIEEYRKNIFPYNSDLYLSYINRTEYGYENFEYNELLKLDTTEGLVSSTMVGENFWVNGEYNRINLFSQNIKIGTNEKSDNILNTPYFHNQLYSDFQKTNNYGKYVGSAYLLLNSLPFFELSDNVFGTTKISSMFKEVGATHKIPYHLMVKWGSLYHRYKTYLVDGYDILTGFTTSNVTNPLNGNTLFYGPTSGTYYAWDANDSGLTDIPYNGKDIGIHPFYQNIFNQIINGYGTYEVSNAASDYQSRTFDGSLKSRSRTHLGKKYWTSLVDNSEYTIADQFYTLLPSDGSNLEQYFEPNNVAQDIQRNFRIIWQDRDTKINYSGVTFPSYGEYCVSYDTGRTYDNKFIMTENYRKVFDLISTFSPQILDEFEKMFLDFSSDFGNTQTTYSQYSEIRHTNFKNLLKEIVTIPKESGDSSNITLLINKLKFEQEIKLNSLTIDILHLRNTIKLTMGNPKEIDPHIWGGFVNLNNFNRFTYSEYNGLENQNLVKLYVGEEPTANCYNNFFSVNNVEMSEENILQFRPLIHIYAGYIKAGGTNNSESFKTYIKNNVFINTTNVTDVASSTNRQSIFLQTLLKEFPKLKTSKDVQKIKFEQGFNEEPIKLELYNFFKSFNDKWVAGNSLGQRLLIEEFMFLDKRNSDIGDKSFLGLDRLLPLDDEKNSKQNLYSTISMLIQGTGFDMRPMPAYVNFYGTNYNNKSKVTSSKVTANNLFGTFLDVDYQDSSPKIVLQYTGPTSKYTDMSEVSRDKFKFRDDSFYIGSTVDNPIIIDNGSINRREDLFKSNKVVAFEVSIGDQNQNIFKSVELNQSSLKNTTESFLVQENLGKSESGSATHQVDIGLFDIYRQSSYSCTVSMMGNVMIQPTMYFYLKNVPMFKGSYWITEVSHSIKNNTVNTTFTGVRIPNTSLPDPKESFMASYRVLFDKLTNKAIAKQKEQDLQITGLTKNETVVTTPKGDYTIDMGADAKKIPNETIVNEAGMTEYGVRYNGFSGEKYIQKVTYNGETYLRGIVTIMDGKTYKIDDNVSMDVLNYTQNINVSGTTANPSYILWKDIKNSKNLFYGIRFDFGNVPSKYAGDVILKTPITFYNPKNLKNPITVGGKFSDGQTVTPLNIEGGIINGPNVNGYGVALSKQLALSLKLDDGDVVFFTPIT